MTLNPILSAPFEIQLHIFFAVPALLVGPLALFRKRRDVVHKIAGYVWMISVLGLSITGLFIKSHVAVIGHFGPIHILSVLGIWGVLEGLYHIRIGNIAKHRATLQSVWFGAMGLAGLFTLLPGRVINRMIFGGPSNWGLVMIAIGFVALFYLARWQRSQVLPY